MAPVPDWLDAEMPSMKPEGFMLVYGILALGEASGMPPVTWYSEPLTELPWRPADRTVRREIRELERRGYVVGQALPAEGVGRPRKVYGVPWTRQQFSANQAEKGQVVAAAFPAKTRDLAGNSDSDYSASRAHYSTTPAHTTKPANLRSDWPVIIRVLTEALIPSAMVNAEACLNRWGPDLLSGALEAILKRRASFQLGQTPKVDNEAGFIIEGLRARQFQGTKARAHLWAMLPAERDPKVSSFPKKRSEAR